MVLGLVHEAFNMSSQLFPANADLHDVLCQSNKMNYLLGPSTAKDLSDGKGAGTPGVVGIRPSPGWNRSRIHNDQTPDHRAEPSSSTVGNKENRIRDRSYSDSGERSFQNPTGSVNSIRYKTELCRLFEEYGSCKYGDKCQFAHGFHELRILTRHQKYKTELCRTFHTTGFCPYGPRCHFVHNAEERRLACPRDKWQESRPTCDLERPKFKHSFSFAGFSTTSRPLDSLMVAPPLVFAMDDLDYSSSLLDYANSPFSSQELPHLFASSMGIQVPFRSIITPDSLTFVQESTQDLTLPPDPTLESLFYTPAVTVQDTTQLDQESSLSTSGSDSPSVDAAKRLPIFSRLSI